MAEPTKVPVSLGALNYIANWKNDLLVLCSAAPVVNTLGKFYSYITGNDYLPAPWLQKAQEVSYLFFAFADFETITSTPISMWRDGVSLYHYYMDIKKDDNGKYSFFRSKYNRQEIGSIIRKRGNQAIPQNKDFPLVGIDANVTPYIWGTYRLTANLSRIFASFVLVYAGLKAARVIQSGPSRTLSISGAFAGITALVIDIFDLQRQIKDASKEVGFAERLVKFPRDNAQEGVDQSVYRKLFRRNCRFNQYAKGFFIAFKVMAILTALKQNNLLGRLANNYSSKIFDVLTVGATVLTFVQHVKYGATQQELEKRNIINS